MTRQLWWCRKTLVMRGWDDEAMRELLPPPRRVGNPYGKHLAAMRLYPSAEVLRAEGTEAWKDWNKERERRAELRRSRREARAKITLAQIDKMLERDRG
jgi:hypothetical protein